MPADLAARMRAAEARSGELSRRRGVCLREGLEQRPLGLPGDADAGVGDLEANHGEVIALAGDAHREHHLAGPFPLVADC